MPIDKNLLIDRLSDIKLQYENEIRDPSGNTAYLIRTSKLIQNLHEFIKEELIKSGINRSYIFPPLGRTSPEKTISGFFKNKKQDILVQLNNSTPLISINVRSQLSSIQKNYDTLFERLVAESVNIHEKSPKLPCGYLYLLPTIGYNSKRIEEHTVLQDEIFNWEKYLSTFFALANRSNETDKSFKYEKICLLAVDFSQNPPKILSSTKDFLDLDLISEEFAETFDYTPLIVDDLIDGLINSYNSRNSQQITSL